MIRTRPPLPFLSPLGVGAFAVALGAVLVLWAWRGAGMFSPGALSGRSGPALGGVTSHAELTCARCHPGLGGRRMSVRCLACHSDIAAELARPATLHGEIPEARACLDCHTDHRGADAELTRFDLEAFPHERFGWELTGRHRQAACRDCHEPGTYGGVSRACIGCHRDDDVHRGELGDDCGECHGTDTWEGATFAHEFPLDHGEGGRIRCRVCHEQAPDYSTYTCYGCHEHERRLMIREHAEEGIRENIDDCVSCHPTGTEDEAEHRGGRGDDD